MSGFFPWNFQAGRNSGGGVPATGCPLEDHPVWSITAGTGPSVLCWDSVDGKSVLVNGDSSDVVNLAYRGISMVDGSIAATISTVSTSAEDWILPLCGRMVNANNLIGARWNNGKFEIVQRKVGTWTSLFSGGPTPALGDRVVFHLSSKFWKLIVNGVVVGEGETTLPDDPGAWGMSQHRAPGFVGNRLFRDYEITDTSLAKTPCMTGPDTPYGVCSASSEFGVNYPAWKGMDCLTDDVADAWLSQAAPMPQWIQWIGPAGQPAMVPDRLHIEARNMDSSSNTARGPESITLQGSNDNGQLWDDIQSWTGLDFGNTPVWDVAVTGAKAYMAIRLQVDNIRDAGSYCQIGTFTVYGHGGQAALASVAYSGAIIERTSDAVYISDIASGGDSNDRAQLFSGTVLAFDGAVTIVESENPITLLSDQTMVATFSWDGSKTGYVMSTRFDNIGQISTYINDASRITIYNADQSIAFTLPEPLVSNEKYRLAMVYEAETCSLFLDGALIGSQPLGSIINTEDTKLCVGGRRGAGGVSGIFPGQLSNIQIWDAVFTQDDIDFDIANPEKTADQRDGTSLTRANLRGYWPLNDGSGNIAHDWSDNANHGTLTGFATDDSQWLHQQSHPLVPQNALMGWGIGTNIAPYSDKFESEWDLSNVIISEGGTRLDGRPAILVSEEGAEDEAHRISSMQDFFVVGENRTKVRVKTAGKDTFGVFIYNTVDGRFAQSDFVFSTETLTVAVGEGKATPLSDGWYEIEIWGTTTVTTESSSIFFGDIDPSIGIDGPAFYIDGIYANNGKIGASIITSSAPAINAIAPLRSWDYAGQFPRNFGELNWNGRSYANAGNGADVNPSTAVIIEMIGMNHTLGLEEDKDFIAKNDSFHFDASREWSTTGGQFFIFPEDGDPAGIDTPYTKDQLAHFVCVYDSRDQLHHVYVDTVGAGTNRAWPDGKIRLNNNPLILADLGGSERYLIGQISLFVLYKDANAQEIIDGDLDAWVAELYQKRVDQGFIPLPVENGGVPVTHNLQPVYYRKGV